MNVIQLYKRGTLEIPVTFDKGWINATALATAHEKQLINWRTSPETQEYLLILAESMSVKSTDMIRVRMGSPANGGGTWIHPKLAVYFARWLSPHFAVWCDAKIDAIVNGKTIEAKVKSLYDRFFHNKMTYGIPGYWLMIYSGDCALVTSPFSKYTY
jgi:hypothetical protein